MLMATEADFIALARDSFKTDGSVDMDKGDLLWSALFKLPEWYFLMTPQSKASGALAAQLIDEKVWFLAFTDPEKLRFYATRNRNLDDAGNALFVTMKPMEAVEFARDALHLSVYGVRFNEAQEHGWFSPLENLTKFPDYLQGKGLI